jgi:hypothetical protein
LHVKKPFFCKTFQRSMNETLEAKIENSMYKKLVSQPPLFSQNRITLLCILDSNAQSNTTKIE